MESFQISCMIDSTDYDCALGIEIWLNSQCLLNIEHVTQPLSFKHVASSQSAQCQLDIVMKNKLPAFTTVDEQGQIVKDARLKISDLCFDQIPLGQVLVNQAIYTHDFNGSGSSTQQKFYGEMGCNGTVSLAFETPIYLWLLEHL